MCTSFCLQNNFSKNFIWLITFQSKIKLIKTLFETSYKINFLIIFLAIFVHIILSAKQFSKNFIWLFTFQSKINLIKTLFETSCKINFLIIFYGNLCSHHFVCKTKNLGQLHFNQKLNSLRHCLKPAAKSIS